MISRTIYPRRRGRRLLAGLAAASIVVALLAVAGATLAVHDETFQLDGDVLASTATSVGGSQTLDWDSLIDSAGALKSLPPDFTSSSFTKDFNNNGATFITNDQTTYATGSKDTLPISTGWQCNFDNNVNSKIDVMNAYAASYEEPGTGDRIVYFGLERNTNTGDANVAFWFLQADVNCVSAGGAVDFVGEHRDGDVLIVSEFSNGGTVSTINVYRWDGDDLTGSLNPNPIASGVDCRNPATGTGDDACAAANTTANGTNGTITTPWLTSNAKDKVGHSLRTSEFFEGGVNLSDAGLGDTCFNTFIADTRSSTSLTATLFDFARGTLGECTSETVTTPKDGAGNTLTTTQIPADPNPASLLVKDSAAITVTGVDTFEGTVTFYLCGPSALNSSATCDAGGDQIGDPVAVTANGTYDSETAAVTSVGRYCWRAEFSGDTDIGVPGSSDSSSGECFTVTPVQPTLVTQAITGPVAFGDFIHDTATLDGTADQPGTGGLGDGSIDPTTAGAAAGGSIHLDVYGPYAVGGPYACAATEIVHAADITVSGDGSYGGDNTVFEFMPPSPGEYVFVASYDGDDPNTLGVGAIACNLQPSNEKVVVQQIPTEISTAPFAYPNDSATIQSSVASDNLPAGGEVIFRLYDNATCTDGDDVAGATGLLYKQSLSVTGGANSESFETTNSSVRVDTNSTVYWRVTYDTGDTAHTGSQSDCVENTSFTFVGDSGPGTLFP